MGLARLAWLAAALLAAGLNAALAGDCPGNPGALGVSRTIVVDPREHGQIGTMSYGETLPLREKEVVLTFDDGPMPPYTEKILDILAAECVKATYFIIGTMAREYPALARRVYDAGHTIGTHSMSHPIPFKHHGVERTRAQIDDGITTIAAALGDPGRLAPFFRFPGFGRTEPAEEYLAQRGLMIWGADIPADDWRKISAAEVAQRGLRRLDGMGKGILLLHDIHQRTVDALPIMLRELKARGYRIVHVVPATPDRPKTITTADEWRMRARPQLALPQIALADVQNLDGLVPADRSADQLCMLQAPERARRIVKLPDAKRDKPRDADKRTAQASEKTRAKTDDTNNKLAGARLATPDIHTLTLR